MNRVTIHIYGSLKDYSGKTEIEAELFLNPSVKDVIESYGVPHVAVFGLHVNDKPVQLRYNISNGDRIEVFPQGESELENHPFNIRAPDQLPTRFIADVHLGKTARNLRLMGFDTVYSNNAEDHNIVKKAVEENRSVLTRDLGLLKNGDLIFGYWLRSTDSFKQTLEIMRYFSLIGKTKPFTRCLECNGRMMAAKKESIRDDLPHRVKQSFNEFKQCADCRRVYWKGTHYKKLMRKVCDIEDQLK